ncbi:hypothetical protein UFOVP71_79 [uncultured Caudovirales phage]|uniref:Uncharacterized protein n=1 Tax=uncultured Caudovirales phage TaxID=2100421 RepID=A0A6J5TAB0_9CAUD|nr:hypothetical protein UFOVP71_79 [uncultured Caudovirales phage]
MLPGAHMGADPEFFSAWTLYDIGPGSSDNLATLMNIIAGRGQPLLAGVECIDKQDLSNSLFGEDITGEHRVWCLKWIASAIGQMSEQTLAAESNNKEMITGLTETASLSGRVITSGPLTNMFFIRHDSF